MQKYDTRQPKERVTVTLDRDVLEAVGEFARSHRQSVSAWINNALARVTGLLRGDLDQRTGDEDDGK